MEDIITYETLDSEEIYDDKDPLKKKTKNYRQKYRKQWEKDERLATWLTQCREDPNWAYCKACNLKLTTRFAAIIKHHHTDKHQKKMEVASVLFVQHF